MLCATLDPEEVTRKKKADRKKSPVVLYTCCLLWCVVQPGSVAAAGIEWGVAGFRELCRSDRSASPCAVFNGLGLAMDSSGSVRR